jgi:signal transduction histidine kinase
MFWNRAAADMMGIVADTEVSIPFCKLFPNLPFKDLESAFRTAVESGKNLKCKTTVEIKGEHRIFEFVIIPANSRIFVLARDVPHYGTSNILSKENEAESIQFSQSQELRLLGQLTSGVAHEVRNPLNAISVVLEALFQDLGDVQEYKLYKEHLFTHVERLKRLMQDLLELGRPIEPSKVTTFDLEDLIRETVEIWNTSTPHNHFTIEIKTDSVADLRVKGHSLKMQQVFMNIFDNAAQHSNAEKKIIIEIMCEEGYCYAKIIDFGSGVKPEHLNKIFDPFFTTRKRGTGLGLSIVKHVVEGHGGKVTIENNSGFSGCTVTVVLPRVNSSRKHASMDTAEIERRCISSFVL